mmetsp:Transcript_66626/g.124353  ORF Transcript_66626/g.124353 Transcript_66626/m.124353 type:complete len:512 (-) Transcript_66626:18-1553(-)
MDRRSPDAAPLSHCAGEDSVVPESHVAASTLTLEDARQRRALSGVSDARTFEAVSGPESSSLREFCKEWFFWIFFALVCISCAISLIILAEQEGSDSDLFLKVLKLESIPIVSVIFTWGHIVLAVQMMFYPVKFLGCWNYRNTGYGLGWQGVVPRKAGVMAEKTCDLMIGRLIKMEEIIDRFQIDSFFETLGEVLLECQRNANEKLGPAYFPTLWPKLPGSVKDELLQRVMEAQKDSFGPVMADLRENITTILNMKDMSVRRYTEEPTLLISLFQQVGRKEFQFIQRCGAQMGFLLGLLQMGLFFVTEKIEWMPWVMLPVSGLLIGNFTNWLAIKMIFRPTHPHRFCFGMLNFQGLFLKRQGQVSLELAKLLTETCVNSREMISYLVSSPGYQGALDILYKHTSKACDDIAGSFKRVVPAAFGHNEWAELKRGAVSALMDELPNHKERFLKYVDQVLQIEETIATRLASLPPDQFEGMLHPAFEEDEWMLITLGGVLGVVVGLVQAAVLGQ